MPTIDTTLIEGFDAMSAEDKLAAVLKVEIPEAVDLSKYISKATFDKKASEAAELAKKLKSKMTDDEIANEEREKEKQESAQKYTDLETKFNELVRKNTIAEYKAQYLSQGMDAALAEETAKALADGDMNKVFANQAKAHAELEQKIKKDLMSKTPKPGGYNLDHNEGGDDDEASALSKKIGRERAEAYKNASETLKHYIQ